MPAEKPTLVEYKAAFLYHFIDFVRWPEAPSDVPFVAGILGKSEITDVLSALAIKKTVGGRNLRVESYSSVDAIESNDVIETCNLLFITSTYASELPRIRRIVGHRSILTVSDTPGLARQGVAINLTMVNDQLKFEINRASLETAGLSASAQLLKLAILVENVIPQ